MIDQAVFLASIFLIAPPPGAVFSSELMSTALNVFVHANASLPHWAERFLRRMVITPDLHRIHHSQEPSEQSGNFGQTFCCWDRLFGTYLEFDQTGDRAVITGIKGLQNGDSAGIQFMLREPFRHAD